MRISELIKRLENVRSEHGDLYVLIGQPDSTGEGDDDLVDMTGECMNVKTIHSVFQHRVRWGQVLEEGRLVHGCRPFVVHLDDGGIRREEGVIRPMLVPRRAGWLRLAEHDFRTLRPEYLPGRRIGEKPMADITRPTVERHSCDIKGCASLSTNPLYWGVSFPIVADDNYDDGSYFGGTRTRIINRDIDLCDYHAGLLLALHGTHTSNYANRWLDDEPELESHGTKYERREQAEGQ